MSIEKEFKPSSDNSTQTTKPDTSDASNQQKEAVLLSQTNHNHVIANQITPTENELPGFFKHMAILRWPSILAMAVIGLLYGILSQRLTFGPWWLWFSIGTILLCGLIVALVTKSHNLSLIFERAAITLATLLVLSSVALLLVSLPEAAKTVTVGQMVQNVLILWNANALVFALWYWHLDQGGPTRRYSKQPQRSELLFPQQSAPHLKGWENWKPRFLDYYWVAYTANTAYSPTDTLVLSARIKFLMLLQTSTAIIIFAALIGHIINAVSS